MTVLLIVGIAALIASRNMPSLSDSEMAFQLIGGFCILVFVGSIIAIPMNHAAMRTDYVKFLVTRDVVEKARERETDIESAALQLKIMEANQWLASAQYWNAHLFDIYIPDDVISLKPIR